MMIGDMLDTINWASTHENLRGLRALCAKLSNTLAKDFASLCEQDSLAEWSKALASGASPQGRGFEPHSCHFHNPFYT